MNEPFADDVVLGWSPNPATVWVGVRPSVHFEEWSNDGQLRRTIEGELSWFKRYTGQREGPPASLVLNFGIDAEDRLWLMVHVPDPDWRDVKPLGAERLIRHEDLEKYFDTRIDVFDLRNARHIGTLTLDDATAGFVQIGNDLILQRVTIDSQDVPRVTLYHVTPNPGH